MRTVFLLGIIFFSYAATSQENTNYKHLAMVIDSYPAFSPDSKKLAFESNRNGNFEIYTMDIDGSHIKQLTFDSSFDGTPDWSPDGKQIVFAAERDGDPEIYIMNSDGSHQQRITNAPGDDSHPHFSPDGKRIIFCSARSTPDLKADWGKQWIEIFSMKTDGSNVQQISHFKTVSTFPSYSPDGKQIVFRMVTDEPAFNWDLSPTKRNSEVFVMDVNGTNPVNISKSAAFDGWPVWSPDGSQIAFASNRLGPANASQIFLADRNGQHVKRLTVEAGSFAQPSFSADGKAVAVYSFRETPAFETGSIALIELKADNTTNK